MTEEPSWNRGLLVFAISAFVLLLISVQHLLGIVVLGRETIPLKIAYTETGGKTAVAPFDPWGLTQWWRRTYRVLEDGRHVGPHTGIINDTRESGRGRYSVWKGHVWLSASDGSDPTKNGKRYEIDRPFNVHVSILIGLLLIGGIALVAAVPGRSIRERFATLSGLNRENAIAVLAVGAVLMWQPWGLLLNPNRAGFLSLALLLAVGFWIRRDDIAPSARIVIYTIVLIFALMLAARIPDPIAGQDMRADWALRAVGIGAAVAAYWRPAFCVVAPAAYAWTNRLLTQAYGGLPVESVSEWIPLSDCSIFLISVLCVTATARRALRREPLPHPLVHAFVVITAAPHFANYAYSAFAKIMLDGGPTSWVRDNQTQWLVLNAQTIGTLSLGAWETLVHSAGKWMETLNILLNVITLATQLASTVAIAFPPIAALLAIVFDVWHVGIAVTTGIVFWKWMALNLAFVAAFRQIKNVAIQVRVAAVALLFLAPNFFYIVALGWYDTPAINVVKVYAVTQDGRKVETPSDWFRQHSYLVTTQYVWKPALSASLLPTGTWGTTKQHAIANAMAQCETSRSMPQQGDLLHPGLTRLVADLHRQSLLDQTQGRWRSFAIYPHHIWSDPFSYADFYRLDLRSVKAYEIKVLSVCRDPLTLAKRTIANVDAGTVSVGGRPASAQ